MTKGRVSLKSIISIAAILICATLAHWPYQYEEVFMERRSMSDNSQNAISFKPIIDIRDKSAWKDESQWRAAGWPIKFYVQVDDPQREPFRAFSLVTVMSTLGGWGAFVLLWVGYDRYALRGRKDSGIKTKNVSILDLLMLTIGIAGCVSYWSLLTSTAAGEKELGKEIVGRSGSHDLSLSVPSVFKSAFTSALHLPLSRITSVSLNEPDSKIVERILQLPYLQKLTLGGGEYDLRLLDRLPSRSLLRELKICGRKLDARTVAVLGTCQQLAKLDLMHTDLNSKALKYLDAMPRLASLNLMRTEVELSSLDFGKLSSGMEEVYLPNTGRGGNAELTIDGWPRLRRLLCNETDERKNQTTVTLRLMNLPELSEIGLDPLQRFDLTVENTPKLHKIYSLANATTAERLALRVITPAFPYLSKFSCRSAPQLRELKIQLGYIRSVEIESPTGLRLEAAVAAWSSGGTKYPDFSKGDGLAVESKQTTIDSLQSCNGISELVLDGVSLDKVDLSSLKTLGHLKKLRLRNASLTAKQYVQLRSLSQIEFLDIERNLIDANAFSRLVSSLPNVKRFSVDPWVLGPLRLEDAPNVESLFSDIGLDLKGLPNLYGNAIRIKEMPMLREPIDLSKNVVYFHIENAPSLVGISTRNPWLKSAVLKGVRDLEYFVGGGLNLKDEIAEAVLGCKNMSHLTLAHAGVTSPVLAKMGQLEKLVDLCLNGSRVDDSVVSQWTSMSNLKSLDLANTEVSDTSAAKLRSFESLESLSIGNCKLTNQGMMELSSLPKLKNLKVSGARVDKALMSSICKFAKLFKLDLSDSTIDPDALSELAVNFPRPLKHLLLKQCSLDGPSLVALVKEQPDLTIFLEGSLMDDRTLAFVRNFPAIHLHEENLDVEQEMAMMIKKRGETTTTRDEPQPRMHSAYTWDVDPKSFDAAGAVKK